MREYRAGYRVWGLGDMDWGIGIGVLVCLILFVGNAYAEKVVLKSGKIYEGKITEENENFLKMDVRGRNFTIFKEEIEKILSDKIIVEQVQKEEKKVEQKKTQGIVILPPEGTETKEEIQEVQQKILILKDAQIEGLSFLYPASWEEKKEKPAGYIETYFYVESKEGEKLFIGKKERPTKPQTLNQTVSMLIESAKKENLLIAPQQIFISGEKPLSYSYKKDGFAYSEILFFRKGYFLTYVLVVKESDFSAYSDIRKKLTEGLTFS